MRNLVTAPVRAATLSGGILGIMAFNRQGIAASAKAFGPADIAKLLAKNSAMARQASLM
jgi:hypothetical protein